jgi:hypothetical protein
MPEGMDPRALSCWPLPSSQTVADPARAVGIDANRSPGMVGISFATRFKQHAIKSAVKLFQQIDGDSMLFSYLADFEHLTSIKYRFGPERAN